MQSPHNNKHNPPHNNKHNPQVKMPLLNRHNQNANITTLQMLMVLLQLLCGEVWEVNLVICDSNGHVSLYVA